MENRTVPKYVVLPLSFNDIQEAIVLTCAESLEEARDDAKGQGGGTVVKVRETGDKQAEWDTSDIVERVDGEGNTITADEMYMDILSMLEPEADHESN